MRGSSSGQAYNLFLKVWGSIPHRILPNNTLSFLPQIVGFNRRIIITIIKNLLVTIQNSIKKYKKNMATVGIKKLES